MVYAALHRPAARRRARPRRVRAARHGRRRHRRASTPVVRMPLPHDPTERSAVEEVSRAIDEASAAAGTDPAVVHSVCVGIPGLRRPRRDGRAVQRGAARLARARPEGDPRDRARAHGAHRERREPRRRRRAPARRGRRQRRVRPALARQRRGRLVRRRGRPAPRCLRRRGRDRLPSAVGSGERARPERAHRAGPSRRPCGRPCSPAATASTCPATTRRAPALAEPGADAAARSGGPRPRRARRARHPLPLLATLDPGHLVLAGRGQPRRRGVRRGGRARHPPPKPLVSRGRRDPRRPRSGARGRAIMVAGRVREELLDTVASEREPRRSAAGRPTCRKRAARGSLSNCAPP